jgi:signal transduction histidine kinase
VGGQSLMARGHFRFAPDTLRRLGEELNPNPDQGLLELIKNAYDANARRCHIELIDTHTLGGSIRISDDGDGLTEREIIEGWLVLGQSAKDVRTLTRLGRIPAGSKGLGRLAALRLGEVANLSTRPRLPKDKQYQLTIDWRNFSEVAHVDEVDLTIRSLQRKKQSSGTQIAIEGLRQPLNRADIKRLARSMVLLADPFGEDEVGFNPTLSAPEFADLEQLVKERYFGDADYHLAARLDGNGVAEAQVLDWRGDVLFQANHGEIAKERDGRPFKAPPGQFDLWAFLLTQETFKLRSSSLREVRAWLQAFGGVHLYLNGLRVSPYGNPGNDWLDLNLRRAQSPEFRPSTNTSIGRLAITDPDGQLLQKTDRSGLIETEAFTELRTFGQNVLDWMARRRLEEAERRRRRERSAAPKRASRSRNTLQSEIDKTRGPAKERLSLAFQKYDKARDKEAEALRREIQLYRTLSTAGITAATFAHETSGNPVKVITQSVAAIERRGRKQLPEIYEKSLRKPVQSIRNSLASLSVLSQATLRLIDHEKRRTGRVDIHTVVEGVAQTFAPFLAGRDVQLRMELAGANPYLQGTQAALESIVTNLLNNSVAVLELSETSLRKIDIRTEISERTCTISVADNGPGISGISLEDIWLPGQTTRPNGTGLGLTIVRDSATDLGGGVEAISEGALGGAEIRIELPIIAS